MPAARPHAFVLRGHPHPLTPPPSTRVEKAQSDLQDLTSSVDDLTSRVDDLETTVGAFCDGFLNYSGAFQDIDSTSC